MLQLRSFARSGRAVAWRAAAMTALLVVLLGVFAAPALAMTMSSAPHVLGRVDASASLTASDPAGVAMLVVDGTVVRSTLTALTVAHKFTFTGVPLVPGAHALRLILRSKDGLLSSPSITVVSWQKPLPPILMTPSNGYCGKSQAILVKAGPGTSRLSLSVNGRTICAKNVMPGQIVNMGTVAMGKGTNTIQVDATNPVSKTTGTFKVKRLDYPWATCIIIVKHEFKLYWVHGGALVKIYPIAIGKPSTPTPVRTWRIDAKYITDWGSVYGPRKMRLFRQIGPDSFEYTGYAIHGTNEEWVIGTMASHGCIRMYNRDVMELYPQVPLGTMVQTRD